jgi:hypothetical protein
MIRSARSLAALAPVMIAGVALAACTNTKVEPKPQCDFVAMKKAEQEAPPKQGPVLVPPQPGTMTPMPLNAVNITDTAITNKVMVQATNAKRLPGGQVEAFARVVNCTDYALQVEGRTHFLDAAQAPVEDATAWQRIYLSPRSMGHYKAMSTRTSAVETYLIELREGT